MMIRIMKIQYEHGYRDTLATNSNRSSVLFAMLTGGRLAVTVETGFQVHNYALCNIASIEARLVWDTAS
jgi:hypothetical protein